MDEKYYKQQCKVTFCGEMVRGKTTLVNALIGNSIITTDPRPTEFVSKVSYGERYKIELIDDNGDINEINAEDMNRLVKPHYSGGHNRQPNKFVLNIEYPFDFDPRVKFIDLPGWNNTESCDKLIDRWIIDSDIYCFVIHVCEPFGESETKYLKYLLKKALKEKELIKCFLEKAYEKVIFIVNFMDMIDEDEAEAFLTYIRGRIGKLYRDALLSAKNMYSKNDFLTTERLRFAYENAYKSIALFGVSAKMALKGMAENNIEKVNKSGIPELKKYLNNIIQQEIYGCEETV